MPASVNGSYQPNTTHSGIPPSQTSTEQEPQEPSQQSSLTINNTYEAAVSKVGDVQAGSSVPASNHDYNLQRDGEDAPHLYYALLESKTDSDGHIYAEPGEPLTDTHEYAQLELCSGNNQRIRPGAPLPYELPVLTSDSGSATQNKYVNVQQLNPDTSKLDTKQLQDTP